jgi:putative phosphoesterase
MLLGIVSDTHGHLANTRDAIRVLESLEVSTVLHCGDIGSCDVIPLFAAWPTHYVLGNVDYNAAELAAAIKRQGHFLHERFGSLRLHGREIAFLHGDDMRRLRDTIDSGEWDLVCCGHTHVAKVQRTGDTLVVNPGAVYRARPHSLAVVDLTTLDVTQVPLP